MPSIFKALCRAGRSESSEASQGERIKRNTGTGQSEAANSTEEFDVDKHLNTIEDLGQTMTALDRATTLGSTPSPAQVAPKGSAPRKGEPWGKNGCYKYQRLDQGNIRLLKIINSAREPPDGEGETVRIVMFELVHVDLDQPPPYTTLSYAWGKDQRRKDDVPLVGDQILPITKSLEMAMAQVLRVNHDGYMWIDQVCIDQSNIVERNQQVSIMGQIYQKAERVLICLGEVGWHAGPFLALVQEIGSLADRATRIEKAQSLSTKRDNQSTLRQDGRPFGGITDDKWDPLHDIFRSPWFTRA